MWVSTLWASGIDNKTNWSVDYLRSLNRNAATDYADIVAYNPAGKTLMDDGRVRLVCFPHCSNVIAEINDVAQIGRASCRERV